MSVPSERLGRRKSLPSEFSMKKTLRNAFAFSSNCAPELALGRINTRNNSNGADDFFLIHICNIKKVHFNMIQAHIYLCTNKLKNKIHIVMLLLFIVFHKCPVCNKVYLETKSSTRSPCNIFIARQ